jgi:hypothetical protein
VERAVQNYLVGLVDLSCYPCCGLSRKPIYAGRKGWALEPRPKAISCLNPFLSQAWVLIGSLHPWWAWMRVMVL